MILEGFQGMRTIAILLIPELTPTPSEGVRPVVCWGVAMRCVTEDYRDNGQGEKCERNSKT